MFTDPMQMRSMAHLRNQQIQAEAERQSLREAAGWKHPLLKILLKLRKQSPHSLQRPSGTPLSPQKERSLPGTAG